MSESKARILYDGLPDSGWKKRIEDAGYEVVEVPDQTAEKSTEEALRSGLQEVLEDGTYQVIIFDAGSTDATYAEANQANVSRELLGKDVKIIAANSEDCFMSPKVALFYLAMGYDAVVRGSDISQLVNDGFATPQAFKKEPGSSNGGNSWAIATGKLKEALRSSYQDELVRTLDTTLGL